MSVALSNRRSLKNSLPWLALALCLTLMAASFLLHDTLFHGRPLLASSARSETTAAPNDATAAPASPAAQSTTITLTEGKWKVAGVGIEPARLVSLPSEVAVAGKVEVNPDRHVEIRSRVPGVVREVAVKLGQAVKKGSCWPPSKALTSAPPAST